MKGWQLVGFLDSGQLLGVVNQCDSFQVKEKNVSKKVWNTDTGIGWERDISEE